MSCLLNIETSTSVCSVAVSLDGALFFEKESFDGPSHAALLGVFVEEALDKLKGQSLKLDAVAVSGGPGSYTGLRIGVSLAKGLCFGYGIPLIHISTLETMASKVIREKNDADALYCPMLDARRMEVYDSIYDSRLNPLKPIAADIITTETYTPFLKDRKVYFFGNGSAKCHPLIQSPNAAFIDNIHPLASEMLPLSEKAFQNKQFEDVAYYEPFYLKEFIATKAKNKVLEKYVSL